MLNARRKVVSISERTPERSHSEQIADLAFRYWLQRRFRGGSPEEDWLRAIYEMSFRETGCSSPRLMEIATPRRTAKAKS